MPKDARPASHKTVLAAPGETPFDGNHAGVAQDDRYLRHKTAEAVTIKKYATGELLNTGDEQYVTLETSPPWSSAARISVVSEPDGRRTLRGGLLAQISSRRRNKEGQKLACRSLSCAS